MMVASAVEFVFRLLDMDKDYDDSSMLRAAMVRAICHRDDEVRAQADKPDPCEMTHTEPFDFAQCETHDTTFALGDKCEWDGVESIYEHLENKVDEQRGLKVLAEMKLGQIRDVLAGPHTSFDTPGLVIDQIREILDGE